MKLLLVLAFVQLFPAPALFFQDGRQHAGDYWEDWGPWGDCSRSCGSGVTVRLRRCISQRSDGGNNCVGPAKSYRSCNIQDCPEGSRDFREEQCSQFDGQDFQGKLYKWLPYYGAENPCELNCIPKGENFYYRHQAAVVDGTPCHPGRRDICVEGVCKVSGCDHMLESPHEEDPCLQCGGNGQSCYLARNSFSVPSLPKGYNQMFIIPVGATNIRIRETVPSRNYLAIKNLRGEYYLNGHWVIDYSRASPIAGTVLYYQRGAEGESVPETITGRGPTTEPLIVEIISQEQNPGVEYEYYLPHNRPAESQYWSYGSWTPCSRECGTGYQSRLVFCTVDNEAYPDHMCQGQPRPLNNRTCNTQACPQTHRMAYLYQPLVWRPLERPRTFVYSWKTAEWSSCTATCGGGSQTRSVQCISHEAEGPRVVEDSVCAAYAPRPASQQACGLQQCAEYSTSSWGPCSVTCGSGEQTRDVVCIGAGGARLQDYACGLRPRPPHKQPCQMPPCFRRIAWHIGDWGLCSKSCGSGLRERQVICSDRDRILYTADRCSPHPKPPTVESCNAQACFFPQLVPSMQDPSGHDNTMLGFRPFNDSSTSVHRPNIANPSLPNIFDGYQRNCSQSYYGCCPDGFTPANGPQAQGCPQGSCIRSRYGCCLDGVTVSPGPNREGCPENGAAPHGPVPGPAQPPRDCRLSLFGCCDDQVTPALGPRKEGCRNAPTGGHRGVCSEPRLPGPCSDWTARYYYDPAAGTCSHFWYGGCQGNGNNFASREDCQRECQGWPRSQPHTVQVAVRGGGREDAAAAPDRSRDMRRVFTVSSSGRQRGTSTDAASEAHRAQVRLRRPAPDQVQNADSMAGVSIDQSDPSTVEGRVGQRVVLPCRVTPLPSSTVVVEWRRDGVPLTAHRHQQQPNGSLLVGPLTLQDSGWLLCVATRGQERDHRYIYLSVPESPQTDPGDQSSVPEVPQQNSPRFSIDQSGSSLVQRRVKQTARLPCRISPASASSSVNIEWTKNGLPVNSLRHTQQSDGSLVIGPLTSEDSGFYTCTASTHHQREHRQLQLKVAEALRITTAPNNVHVSRGSTAHLPCVVSGDNVNVGWSRNGVPVRPDGGRVQVSVDGSLILNNVQPADEGAYTCNAYIGTFSVSATAEVRVSKDTQPGPGLGLPSDCVDQPELANCELIVYARLCSSQYYSSFCCASCARHSRGGTAALG
ncbi:LOW QUALITY PROTEIN: papilin-like [Anguilla rostrata]|uniref:LOW QUALITY PROTEIN: papilin-like n=1 Tax=Anguilla rostrata TaxID=7938 RepID=UPI0030CD03FC